MYALLQTDLPPRTGSDPERHRDRPEIIEKGMSRELRARLLEMHNASFDRESGGLKLPIKFLDADSSEYSLVQAAGNHPLEEKKARLTLDKALALIDPEWGGIYRYSSGGRWDCPHHAKTLAGQAAALRLYSLAYALFHEDRYLLAARRIYDYMQNFLLDAGGGLCHGQSHAVAGIDPAWYFSLADRRRKDYGIPPVFKTRPVHENGAAVEALAMFYEFCGEKPALHLAVSTADWLARACRMDNGGFRADDRTRYLRLADTLASGRGMLQLYRVTADTRYLDLATHAAGFIASWFSCKGGGFKAAIYPGRHLYSEPQIDENVSAVRYLNLLSHYCNESGYKNLAAKAFEYLVRPDIATGRVEEAGILLADRELSTRPIRISIAGPGTDPGAQGVFKTAMPIFGWYKVIQWDK